MSRNLLTPLRLLDDEATAVPSATALAGQELMRPAVPRGHGRDLEPFSRGWFEELEQKRYLRAGAWLPKLLEFNRQPGESLLMLGPGLGSDALQYLRHGTQVTIALTPADAADAVRRNLEFRAAEPTLVSLPSAERLPFPRNCFDLGYVNALAPPSGALSAIFGELYRVLKPGGKLFALLPARRFLPWWPAGSPLVGSVRSQTPGMTRRDAVRLCEPFQPVRVCRRHLRRSELPWVLRPLPIGLFERCFGHVLMVRALKPLTAAFGGVVHVAA